MTPYELWISSFFYFQSELRAFKAQVEARESSLRWTTRRLILVKQVQPSWKEIRAWPLLLLVKPKSRREQARERKSSWVTFKVSLETWVSDTLNLKILETWLNQSILLKTRPRIPWRYSSIFNIQLSISITLHRAYFVCRNQDLDLSEVINLETMAPILADKQIQERLMQYLPESEILPKTEQEIRTTLTTPQFKKVPESLLIRPNFQVAGILW